MQYKFTFILLVIPSLFYSQLKVNTEGAKSLTLEQAIILAKDSSLNSFVAKNTYLSSYWEYRAYKAERLPLINLDMTPFSYNDNFVKRYDSESNLDVYKSQQSLYSYANLSVKQNLDITGGTFYLDTQLGYLSNFGLNKYEQYSSVPFRIGYSQSLFGFNRFKWQKKIEPVRFEKAQKKLMCDLEEISEQTTAYFFDLELNQKIYDLAKKNVDNCDTLYRIGLERFKIGSLSHSDLLTLKLVAINSRTDVGNAELNLKRSTSSLASYLRLNRNVEFHLELPNEPMKIDISVADVIRMAKANNPTFTTIKETVLTAQQNYEQTSRESSFSASLSASVGFNQVATNLSAAYFKPLQQDVVSVRLSVPLVDWGVRKGKVNIARQQLNTAQLSAKQTEQVFEEDLYLTVCEMSLRQSQIQSTKEAREIAEQAYYKSRQLFEVGKTDVNAINLAIVRQIEAERNYISALKNYWQCYYKIRRLTLYDFVSNKSITIDSYKPKI